MVLAPDSPRFTVLAASDAYLRATKKRREEMVGRPVFEVFPDNPDDPSGAEANSRASFERVLARRMPDAQAIQQHDVRRPDSEGGGFESHFWSPLNTPVLDDQGQVRYIIHRVEEVTELVLARQKSPRAETDARLEIARIRHEADAARAREARLHGFYNAGLLGMIFWNVDGTVTDANDKFLAMVGYDRDDLLAGRVDWARMTPPEYRPLDEASLRELRDTGVNAQPFEKEFIRKDGSRISVLVAGAMLDETRLNGVAFVLDITERKRAEEIKRRHRTVKALSDSRRALLRAMDEADVLREVCRIVAEECGHKMVWIGYAEDDEAKSVRPVAHAGFEDGYLETLNLSWADTERGRGPTGTAIRTGKPQSCRDLLHDPLYEPWRELALSRGYRSSIALPLVGDGQALGALNIYSTQPDAFPEDEAALFSELASELAYRIQTLRLRAAQARAEEALRESERKYRAFFDNSIDAVLLTTPDGPIHDANAAACQMFGVPHDELVRLGRVHCVDLDDPRLGPALEERARTGSFRGELTFKRGDGSRFPGEISTSIFTDRDGTARAAMIIRDVTERKLAEERVRELLAQTNQRAAELDAIIQAIPDAVYFGGVNGITRCNAQALRMLGASSLEDLQERIGELGAKFRVRYEKEGGLVEPENLPFTRALMGEAASLDTWATRGDNGEDVLIRGNAAPVVVDGAVVGAVAVNIDITDQFLLREALKEAKDAALQDSEQRLRLAQQAARIGSFEWNVRTGVNVWTKELEAMYGLAPGEFGKTQPAWEQLVHPEDRSDAVGRVNEALETGEPVEGEWRVIWRDSSVHWIMGRFQVLKDDASRPLHLIGVNIDITDRKRAEEELRKSECRERERAAELAALLDAVPTPVFIAHDPDCLHISGNGAADELLRNPRGSEASLTAPSELRPRHFKAVKDGRELRSDELPAQRAARGVLVQDFEFSLVFDDGTTRHMLGYGTPLLDEQGQPRGAVNVLVDITKRKQAEEALRNSENKFSILFRKASLPAVLSRSPDHVFIDVNDAWAELFGYTREEAIGKTSSELGVNRDIGRRTNTIDEVGRHKQVLNFEQTLFAKSGRAHTVLTNVNMLVIDGQDYALTSVQDITERKQAESALRKSEIRYRSLFSNMLDGYAFCRMLYDAQGRPEDFVYLDVNDAFERLTGLTDVIGKRVTEVIPGIKEAHPELLEIYDRVASTGKPERFELLLEPLGIWFSVGAYRSEPGHFTAVFENVTERKRAEEALIESERRYRSLFESMTEGFALQEIVCDEAGEPLDCRFLDVNPAFERLTGLGADNLVGRTLNEAIAHDDLHWMRAGCAVALAGQEVRFESYSSTVGKHYEISAYRSEPGRFCLMVTDITKRKESQAALNVSREKLQLLFDVLPVGVSVLDRHGRVVKSNPALEKILALSREDLVRENYGTRSYLRPDRTPMPTTEFASARVFRGENAALHVGTGVVKEDGDVVWTDVSAVGCSFADWGAVVVTTDVTEVTKASAALEEAYEQERELATRLQSIREEERTRISREIHDELAQNLTALRIGLTRLGKQFGSAEDSAGETVRESLTLVDSTLGAVRRIAADLRPAVLDALGLGAALSWQAQEFSRRLGIPCTVELETDLPKAERERSTAVFRIFQEALSNVAQHAAASEVRARLWSEEGILCLELRDNGLGIPEVKEPGRKALGLLGMRERAAALGGTVDVSGAAGGGTRVLALIPLKRGKGRGCRRKTR
jgi:PAS domain S-box-containing protein